MIPPTVALPSRLELRDGLVGLPEARTFDVRPSPAGGLIELISVDDPGLGFAASFADGLRDGYSSQLVAAGLAEPDDTILVLLAVHGDPPSATANLAGPLVVATDGRARQLVLDGAQYPLRAPVGVDG